MLFAVRRGIKRRIPDTKQKEYENMGYSIEKPDGTVISTPTPSSKKTTAKKTATSAE